MCCSTLILTQYYSDVAQVHRPLWTVGCMCLKVVKCRRRTTHAAHCCQHYRDAAKNQSGILQPHRMWVFVIWSMFPLFYQVHHELQVALHHVFQIMSHFKLIVFIKMSLIFLFSSFWIEFKKKKNSFLLTSWKRIYVVYKVHNDGLSVCSAFRIIFIIEVL